MNWNLLRRALAIAWIALTGSACCSQRAVSRENIATYSTERAEKNVDSVAVVERDTIMEVTTIIVDRNETGDTIRMSTVTDRERVRNRDAIAVQRTKTEVKVDTVYVEKRDSVLVSNTNGSAGSPRVSPVVLTLKWVFWIIIGLIALVIVVRIRGRP